MSKQLLFFTFIIISIALACYKNPYKATNKIHQKQVRLYQKSLKIDKKIEGKDWVGSINFNLRKPLFVVIHHTAQNSCDQTLKTFTLSRTQVSAHYVICKSGRQFQMLSDYLRAWHAGAGAWGTVTDMNSVSIGIELDNNGNEPFTDAQMKQLLLLLEKLKKDYNIPSQNFIGHADLAPGRKNDPSIYFDWQKLAQNGFGKWYADTTALKVPVNFTANLGLKLLGYRHADTLAVQKTFRRKYFQKETNTAFSTSELKVLWALVKD